MYWPQNTIDGGKLDYKKGIDLSKEYSIEGNLTQFYWFDITDGNEQPVELQEINGFFSLTEDEIGKRLRCKMANATFPMLTGNHILVYEVTITDGVGIEPITNHELRITVYPNPTTGELRITNYELQVTNVEVFDVYGRKQKIILHSPFSILNSIDITQLPKGLYFLKITTEKGTLTKKIIKY